MKKIILILMFILSIYFLYDIYSNMPLKVVSAVSYSWGSRGPTVTEIQRRLKNWGYYDGSVDGVYGYRTYIAVRKFQSKNGLRVDGIVGPETLRALGINPGSSTNVYSANKDQNLLSRAINGEARGEPYIGMVAVGGVIMNRVRDPRFPNTIPGVIYQPGAFTAVTDGQINAALEEAPTRAARDALNGWDPSGGALYYYNPAKTTNKWIWSRPIIKIIGSHYFCK